MDSAIQNTVEGDYSVLLIVTIIAIFSIVSLVILFAFKTMRKTVDRFFGRDPNADQKATPEQLKIIENGYRELGIFYKPKKKMTKADARETIHNLETQLRTKRGK